MSESPHLAYKAAHTLSLIAEKNRSKVWYEIFKTRPDFDSEFSGLRDADRFYKFVQCPEFACSPYGKIYYNCQKKVMRYLRSDPSLFEQVFPDIDYKEYWERKERLSLFTEGSELYFFQICLKLIDYRPSKASERINWLPKSASVDELREWLIVNSMKQVLKDKGLGDGLGSELLCACDSFLGMSSEVLQEKLLRVPGSEIVKEDVKGFLAEVDRIVENARRNTSVCPIVGFWMYTVQVSNFTHLEKIISDVLKEVESLSEAEFAEWLMSIGFSEKDVANVSGNFAKHSERKYINSMKDYGEVQEIKCLGDVFIRPPPRSILPNDPTLVAFNTRYIEPPTFNGNRLKSYIDRISEKVFPSDGLSIPSEGLAPMTIPIVSLNQSSGFGKSKLFHHPVPGVIFVYLCLRQVEADMAPMYGYPLRSRCANEFLTTILAPVARLYGKESSSAFVETSVEALMLFMSRVVCCIEKSEKFDVPIAKKNGLCFATDDLDMRAEGSELKHSKEFLVKHKNSFKVVFILDELATLSLSTHEGDNISGYRVLRHILAHIRKFQRDSVNGVPFLANFIYMCIDTNTTASETHPSQLFYASQRIFSGLNVDFPDSFVFKSTQDIFVSSIFKTASIKSWNSYIFTNLSFMTALAFGRPLWYSYLVKVKESSLVFDFNDVLMMACRKFDHSHQPPQEHDPLAVFQIMMITTGIVSPSDSHVSGMLVKSRLAHLHSVTDNGNLSISYISEPVLSAYALNRLGSHFLENLQDFSHNIKTRLMNVGSLGEFVSVILILYAFYTTKPAETPKFAKVKNKRMPSDSRDQQALHAGFDIYSSPVKVSSFSNLCPKPTSNFLSNLLGSGVYEKWHSRVKQLKETERDRFLDIIEGHVQANHSIYYPKEEKDFNLIIREAIARRAIVKCFDMFPVIDIVIPVVTRSGLVTGIGISVKRDSGYRMKVRSRKPTKIVLDHMEEFSTACLPKTNPLVHCDEEHGGNVYSNKWMFILMSLYSDSVPEEPSCSIPLKRSDSSAFAGSNLDSRATDGAGTGGADSERPNFYIDSDLRIAVFGAGSFCAETLRPKYGTKVDLILNELLCMRPGVSLGNALELKGSYPVAVRSVSGFQDELSEQLQRLSSSKVDFTKKENRDQFWSAIISVILSIWCGNNYFGSYYKASITGGLDAYSLDRLPDWPVSSPGMEQFIGHFDLAIAKMKKTGDANFSPVKHFTKILQDKVDYLLSTTEKTPDFSIPLTKEWCGLLQ